VFEELGLICKSDFSDEVSRYLQAGPGHDHHHHHIVCRSCERIEAVDFCILQAQEQLLSRLGFSGIRHRLEFSGICRACS
jgi:Fur family ferric uptake transcriptional regulator